MSDAAANVTPIQACRSGEETVTPCPQLPVFLTPQELADMLKLPSVETVYTSGAASAQARPESASDATCVTN